MTPNYYLPLSKSHTNTLSRCKPLSAFGKRKPNFNLWLPGVGCAVHGYMQKNPHSCKNTKMATPLDFFRGMSLPVNWYRY